MTDLESIAEDIAEVEAEAREQATETVIEATEVAVDAVARAEETAASIIANAQMEAERIMDAAYIRGLEDRIATLEARDMPSTPPPVIVETPAPEPEPEEEPEEEPILDAGPVEDAPDSEPSEDDIKPNKRNRHFWYR